MRRSGGHTAIRRRDFVIEPASAILGRTRKVPGTGSGHRSAGQEKKGIPFELVLLANIFSTSKKERT
ncbi:MAG: hypothetical protein WD032_06445 [Nitrospirales bacterium]